MEDSALNELLERYRTGVATPEDLAFLESWYLKYNQQPYVMAEAERQADVDLIWASVKQERLRPVVKKLWPRVTVAAAAIATVVFGLWFYELTSSRKDFRNSTEMNSAQAGRNDIAPGRSTATITLANGKSIVLSDAKTGVIIGDKLIYSDGSEVAVSQNAPGNGKPPAYGRVQTLIAATPRGGTYQVILPDGTHVWLNADSKVSFPSRFSGKRRSVWLEGEAYFEVAKDKTHPFIVESGGNRVEVLGTHFNVNAYTDEKVTKTTLLEGSVNVNGIVLKPDQQAILKGADLKVIPVISESFVDWKNGEFYFEKESLASIMRKVSRWYDVEVDFAGMENGSQTFSGSVSRAANLSKVLKTLENLSNLKFNLEGKKVIITK